MENRRFQPAVLPAFAALLALLAPAASAKPIAFRGGTSVMAEYGGGFMREAQVFYAPTYWLSLGPGWLELEQEDGAFSREIAYLRGNVLLRRWNLPAAQANVFGWGGLGQARGSDFEGEQFSQNAGAQFDYETLRVYGSLRSDWQHADAFSHRIDTLQLGAAPYPHAYDGVATWVLLQARNYTGGIADRIETAALLRLFRGPVWVEAGVTDAGALQAMAMFNF